MIISYPYLPERSSAESEQDYEKRVLDFVQGHGIYPASHDMRWHGGIHHCAPEVTPLPVRAIADGEVVAYRWANTPVLYEPGAGAAVEECDNSFVLIRHATETGDGVKVVYYSLYMHLMNEQDRRKITGLAPVAEAVRASTGSAIAKPPPGTKVWRKENGFDSRCCAYGVLIAVLSEYRLPDSKGKLNLEFPEGYTPRREK